MVGQGWARRHIGSVGHGTHLENRIAHLGAMVVVMPRWVRHLLLKQYVEYNSPITGVYRNIHSVDCSCPRVQVPLQEVNQTAPLRYPRIRCCRLSTSRPVVKSAHVIWGGTQWVLRYSPHYWFHGRCQCNLSIVGGRDYVSIEHLEVGVSSGSDTQAVVDKKFRE